MKRMACIIWAACLLVVFTGCDMMNGDTIDETEAAIEVSVDTMVITLIKGETMLLVVETNDEEGVEFTSWNTDAVTVDETGLLTAHEEGQATITVTAKSDSSVSVDIEVTVTAEPSDIVISGSERINVGATSLYEATLEPEGAAHNVLWEVDDESFATIDEEGVLTAHAEGFVTVKAVSAFDASTTASFVVEIVRQMLIASGASAGAETDYDGVTFTAGADWFEQLSEGLNHATENTTVFVVGGTHDGTLDITMNGIGLFGVGENAPVIDAPLLIGADDISIEGFVFTENAAVHNTLPITGFTFRDNVVEDDVARTAPFLHLQAVADVVISQNTFKNFASTALLVDGIVGGDILIEKNRIEDVDVALSLDAGDDYPETTVIRIERNVITGVATALDIVMRRSEVEHDILAYARFNDITAVSSTAASIDEEGGFDFTLNHWDGTPEMTRFENISEHDLRGYYENAEDILSEAAFDPDLPVKILVVDAIDEIMIGETHTFTYEVLPLELETDRIRWVTGDPERLHINLAGMVTAYRSGTVAITVRSTVDWRISTSVNITVTTTPGIELIPERELGGVLVGESFTLSAQPFPVHIEDEAVRFESSDETIATIDESGLVTTHASGTVTFEAVLLSDESVSSTFTLDVYESLDPDNLLDVLTQVQAMYSTHHTWTAYGVGFNYVTERYESVSRYYFGEYDITEMIIPVSHGIRPGEGFADHPDGITQFNPYNVYWVVIHDTANTNPGSGALAHANYLWNRATGGHVDWVSWHFTIDDVALYQHLPETERAFHAGDGSVLPGQSANYLGGGNRNGIGIEMAINQDSDMMRTWQRTAKFASDLMVKYNLPREHLTYHQDFSGKLCPRTMITAGLRPLFEEFVDIEYDIASRFPEAIITLTSHDPEYLDDSGRIIKMPQRAMTVSYTITVEFEGVTESRTFHTYLPGTDH